MDDCFYLSNMSPQTHAFNAGIWSKLESAVYLNALLLATPLCAKDTTIDVHLLKERAATRMTEMWLERQNIEFFRDDEMYHYTIRGNQCYKPFFADINGDFSLAAFFFCAAAITASTVTVTHLDAKSSQADRAILDILAKMGCSIRSEGHFVSLTGPSRLKAIPTMWYGMPFIIRRATC